MPLRLLLDEHLRGPLWSMVLRHNLAGVDTLYVVRVEADGAAKAGAYKVGILARGPGKVEAEGSLTVRVKATAVELEKEFTNCIGMKFVRIPAGKFRDESYDLPPGTAYPVKIDAKLMFRTFPQQLTDLVRKRFPRMPAPQPVEMAHLDTVLAASSNSSPGQP